MEKQQGSKYKVLYNIFNAGGERRKTGNPQNQRIDGWYDNAPRVLANQLCALSLGEQSVANVERAESFPLPPSFFFPLLLPLLPHSPSHSTARLLFVLLLFVLQTQLVQSTLVVRADGGL